MNRIVVAFILFLTLSGEHSSADPIRNSDELGSLVELVSDLQRGESIPIDLRFSTKLRAGGIAEFRFHEASRSGLSTSAESIYRIRGEGRVLARGAGRTRRTQRIPLGATLVVQGARAQLVVLPFQRTLRGQTAFHRLEIDLEQSAVSRMHRAPEQIFGGKHCGATRLQGGGSFAHSLGTTELPVMRATNGYVATLSTDAAGDFFNLFGASSNTEIAVIVNQASAVYEAQLAIRIDVVDQNVHVTDSPFPASVTDPVVVLQDFAAYFVANRHLVAADAYMLFVDRELDGSTLGIAFIDAICQSVESVPAPFSVVRYQTRAATWVTVAHELGHNFGADHVDTPKGIMSTVLTSPLPDTFATASINQINNYIKSIPSQNQCLEGARIRPPKAPRVTLTTTNSFGGIEATVKVAKLQAACSVRLRASSSSSRVKRGSIVARSTPSSRTVRFTTGASLGSPQSSVYLVAEHRCPGLSSSFSRTRKLRAAAAGVNATSFIRRLRQNLQESLF